MNLSTKPQARVLSHAYRGSRLRVGDVLYKPMTITAFEVIPSQLHPGKQALAMQVVVDGEEHLLITESYTLIKTLQGTEDRLPHHTKIVRKRDGYYYFAALLPQEITTLNF